MMKPTPEAARIMEEKKRSDWTCLVCGHLVFARHNKCFSCRTPKPTPEEERVHNERKLAEARAREDAKQRAIDFVAAQERRLLEAPATARECWASGPLAWFQATARASPTGVAYVRMTTSECNVEVAGPYWAEGYVIEYNQCAKPGHAADELFTIHKWQKGDTPDQDRSQVVAQWTEVQFLVKASYDAYWNRLLTAYAHTFTQGPPSQSNVPTSF
jgi:hypothetical protein